MNAACLSGTLVTVGYAGSTFTSKRLTRAQLYGLIFIGSSAAFSSMVGACIVFMTTSYVLPQGILAWRGRDKVLPPRALDLGKFGLPLNVLACVWVFFIDIIYCIPTAYPVTAENMNWIRYVVRRSCPRHWSLIRLLASSLLDLSLSSSLRGMLARDTFSKDPASILRCFKPHVKMNLLVIEPLRVWLLELETMPLLRLCENTRWRLEREIETI